MGAQFHPPIEGLLPPAGFEPACSELLPQSSLITGTCHYTHYTVGPLLFLIYINDLPNELKSTAKLFADDTSLFTVVKDINESANILNDDLLSISKWAYNWKMLFNPDPTKPALEVLFSRKKKSQVHPPLSLNNIPVERTSFQKHLGVLLDEKLDFKKHIDSAISKVNKGISEIKKT